ncbi:3-ketoacyl-CoA thiolase with broad chain length specificity [Mortierella sp. GBA35]|nr:3-ketoacyl-CoA thiolase with broad chain length specificity [Mortierella sp. GBA35]KAF9087663.1 3-ketoacyl-CoA thiolase with broad chain length specificity [Mortierella sp. AD031]KAG0203430.1 3-ketoacyl-CoA thiolase with broad chain length specificity [Mortierella sp. NVP41]
MASRLSQIASHLVPESMSNHHHHPPGAKIGVKSDDDIVICCAVRTPITRAFKGGFKDTVPEDLLAEVLIAVRERTKLDPTLVEDICVGNVLQPSGGATTSRMAALYAGYPVDTACYTVNRQCASGLQAVVNIANAIEMGQIEIGIGAGVESMTMGYGPSAMAAQTSEKIPRGSQEAADCQLTMGITSENVARDFGIDRKSQDEYAALSFQRAALAQKEGRFKDEIVPVRTFIKDKTKDKKENTNNNNDDKNKNEEDQRRPVVISQDDGIRDGVTFESLSKIRPAFLDDGSTTAGNASQISDGAAAVLLMRRRTAKRLGMPILGKYITSVVKGVNPRHMGIGPAVAIPAVCKKIGIEIKDVDVFELNEAFASQTVYTIRKCGLDTNKTNPNGGALALGHPLGCTGARQIATLLNELKRRKERVGIVTMCMATGMGAAAIFENEQL